MRGVTEAEAAMLAMLVTYPNECALCEPRCGSEIAIITDDRSVGDALARDGRAILWPCKHTAWRHGRITDAGRLALRLRSLVAYP